MLTEERQTQINYAKALNRIAELELIISQKVCRIEFLDKEILKQEMQIDKLESQIEDLELQMEDQAMFTPNQKMSLIELMEIEEMIGEVTFT